MTGFKKRLYALSGPMRPTANNFNFMLNIYDWLQEALSPRMGLKIMLNALTENNFNIMLNIYDWVQEALSPRMGLINF